ncbi:stage V sporulation protein AB [Hazenella coriacea]|uniref:Stage V sporulation protein AB n=1 Tax=Hazenella coriacea TaxID=1179467 RepID=A0A4R3L1K9_9BACL|nr:stage V sporulation protein AB [Hazenella coriacea]TCS93461.1 stage V sporulation protein AB [Hazenella coriacea]
MDLFTNLTLIIVGMAGGIAVGSGFVAFITVLDIISRLAQISGGWRFIHNYEYAIVTGVLFFTIIDFHGWVMPFPIWMTTIVGLFMGIFIGMLAAALTEVINVLPILVKRLRLQIHILTLLMAMALGKIAGSLFQWMIFEVW